MVFPSTEKIKRVGRIEGLLPTPRSTTVGVSSPTSLAAKAEHSNWNENRSFWWQKVASWEEVEALYEGLNPGKSFELVLKKEKTELKTTLKKVRMSRSIGFDLGLHSTELFVEEAVKDAPAQKAGLQKGDRIVSVSGHPLKAFSI